MLYTGLPGASRASRAHECALFTHQRAVLPDECEFGSHPDQLHQLNIHRAQNPRRRLTGGQYLRGTHLHLRGTHLHVRALTFTCAVLTFDLAVASDALPGAWAEMIASIE